jgi:CspA family cold shock protein
VGDGPDRAIAADAVDVWRSAGQESVKIMATGRIIRFDEIKGYGFISPSDGGEDIFVHANELTDRGMRVSAGSQVEFRVVEGDRGLKAFDVRIIDHEPVHAGLAYPADTTRAGGASHPADQPPADDELFEVFPEREFVQQITELLLTAAPQLTGTTIIELRGHLVAFARKNGWVE